MKVKGAGPRAYRSPIIINEGLEAKCSIYPGKRSNSGCFTGLHKAGIFYASSYTHSIPAPRTRGSLLQTFRR